MSEYFSFTVISFLAVILLLLVAVIVTLLPLALTPVTTPVFDTVATDVSLLCHLIVSVVGTTFAVRVMDSPTFTLSEPDIDKDFAASTA